MWGVRCCSGVYAALSSEGCVWGVMCVGVGCCSGVYAALSGVCGVLFRNGCLGCFVKCEGV